MFVTTLLCTHSACMHSFYYQYVYSLYLHITSILTYHISIAIGWKSGTKITYKPTKDFPKYIIFIIKEKKHSYFTRERNNLIYDYKMPTGTSNSAHNHHTFLNPNSYIHIKLLTQELITIDTIKEKLHIGSKYVVKGKGMPINDKQTEYGDLIVTVSAATTSTGHSHSWL